MSIKIIFMGDGVFMEMKIKLSIYWILMLINK